MGYSPLSAGEAPRPQGQASGLHGRLGAASSVAELAICLRPPAWRSCARHHRRAEERRTRRRRRRSRRDKAMSPGVKGMISRSSSPYDCVCSVHKSHGRNCAENRQGKTPAGRTSWKTAEAAFSQLGAAGWPAGLLLFPQLLPSSVGSLPRSVSFLVP